MAIKRPGHDLKATIRSTLRCKREKSLPRLMICFAALLVILLSLNSFFMTGSSGQSASVTPTPPPSYITESVKISTSSFCIGTAIVVLSVGIFIFMMSGKGQD
ncbi:hypothetical protein CUJ83_03245 [Methanocella sp. CWC-04]|uniref:Uncharacterized protein n=1 Tax=Methanooceanicella nereidis TaxID=2052831 RepID=A0AAP2RBA1_9EURY|nr:hypothetical protein [Methanocella sp. CWC-04]MCD1294009.1 hypothetical protein [Methanocella sp. CWC-04]